MSSKVPSRQRKSRKKDEMKQDIVAQVHKVVKRESSSERENVKKIDQTEDSSESNRTFILEDRNDNYSLKTPSRDVSVDGETQINSKIMNLIENEMRRDINKHSHFTDSRPQSLSFYEDEKIPEELSGNLELLSPEERRHYKRRKEYGDNDLERNAYNSIQDALSRENDDVILNGSSKKSKSRKKKHSNDPELGLGDSREMMIPKEKRKSKKKKREYSPLSSNSSKRKHRKRDEEFEPKNDITLALEELQDDVFENSPEDFLRPERTKKSPRKSDKLYVQRKTKFEISSRSDSQVCRLTMPPDEDYEKRYLDYNPIELAVGIQKCWMPFTMLCHGLLGGLALAHYLYLSSNDWTYDIEYIKQYANYSTIYTCLFYFLCIICFVSVCDKYDVSHIDLVHLRDLFKCRKSSIVILIYATCMIVHLVSARVDDKLSELSYNSNTSSMSITDDEIKEWNNLSYWRAILATIGWVVVACASNEDLFYVHLKNMEKYALQEH